MEEQDSLYGISASARGNALTLGKKTLTLQSIKFWVLTYLFSVIVFQFLKSYIPLADYLNLILFPFSVMLVGDIAIRFINSFPLLYNLLYPTVKIKYGTQSTIKLLLISILKIVIYIIVWKYTFVLGIIGLIYKVNDTRKMI